MVCLVKHNDIALGQQETVHGGIQQEQRVINDDNLSSRSFLAHLAHVAIGVKIAFAPRALIAIATDLAADISWELKVERFKVAVEFRVWIVGDIDQAREVAVFSEELHPRALAFQAIDTHIVADAFDEGRVKVFDVLLDKGNVFVKQLLLQRLIGGTDNGDLAGTHDRDEVSQAVMSRNHRSASEIQVALRLDLNAPYWTRRHLADSDNIAEAITPRAIIAQSFFVSNRLAF